MKELMYFAVPLVATIIIEAIVAWLIGIRNGREQLLIMLVNIITNLLLNLSYSLLYGLIGYTATWLAYLIGEPAVVMVEYMYFRKYLETETDCLKTSLLLNVTSALAGLLWSLLS